MISQEEADRQGLGFPRGCALAVVYGVIFWGIALAILFLLYLFG